MVTLPDYKIYAQNNNTQLEKGEIGAAWINDDGSITLRFNPYVTVPVGPEYGIRMLANKDKALTSPKGPGTAQRQLDIDSTRKKASLAEDEVPF